MRFRPLSLVFIIVCVLGGGCACRGDYASNSRAEGSLAADTGRVAVEGGTLYYEAKGSGPSVVLLHAGTTDLAMWDPQMEPLTRSFRVIRYDARGHGRSSAPMGPHSTVEDLRSLLDALAVERAHLVGMSMGAGVALNFATTYPGRVSTLTLASTSGPPPGVSVPPGTPPPLTEEAGRVRLRSLSMPRLLIVGQEDSPDHLMVAERVEAEAPEVSVVRIEGGEHLVNRDKAEVFNEVLIRFLRRE